MTDTAKPAPGSVGTNPFGNLRVDELGRNRRNNTGKPAQTLAARAALLAERRKANGTPSSDGRRKLCD